MNEPNVAAELTLFAQLKKDRGRLEQSGRGGTVVVSAGSSQASSRPARIPFIVIAHIGSVKMVRHDDCLAAVLTGNDDDNVALVSAALLIVLPATHPGE